MSVACVARLRKVPIGRRFARTHWSWRLANMVEEAPSSERGHESADTRNLTSSSSLCTAISRMRAATADSMRSMSMRVVNGSGEKACHAGWSEDA
jgi:hypothetical protein